MSNGTAKLLTLLFLAAAAPGAEALAGEKPLKILALGDSTTAGTPEYLSPLEAPPNGRGNERSQYAFWIKKKHRSWTIINHGIAGQRSDEILERFKRERGDFDFVIVLAGVNDLYQGYDPGHVKRQLKAIYELADQKKMKVLACTILPYNVSTDEVKRRMNEVNGWILGQAIERGHLYCDTYTVLNDPSRPGNLIGTQDSIHPNEDGYRQMGEAIEKVLVQSGATVA